MKICIISDIHGLTEWKNIINKERGNVDRFIFLGDYVDDKHSLISPEEQLENPDDNDNVKKVKEYAKKENAEVIPLCVKIEEELVHGEKYTVVLERYEDHQMYARKVSD